MHLMYDLNIILQNNGHGTSAILHCKATFYVVFH